MFAEEARATMVIFFPHPAVAEASAALASAFPDMRIPVVVDGSLRRTLERAERRAGHDADPFTKVRVPLPGLASSQLLPRPFDHDALPDAIGRVCHR